MNPLSRLRDAFRDHHAESLSDREITMRQRVERRRRLGAEPKPKSPPIVIGIDDDDYVPDYVINDDDDDNTGLIL
jgi:hypothetical protein